MLASLEGAAAYCITFHNEYLYSGEGNTLSVYDVRDGAGPPYERLYRMRFPSFIDDLILHEGQLW
ncbi:MAG: hypothetical protein R3330_01430, partial [Saprospiraceae bacterium]|nr:hypothetical protein [Saprospiraceae bacterium]